jgi:DNA-binding transcriptional LysR family regulator
MPPANLRLRSLIDITFRQIGSSFPSKIIECTPYSTVRNLVHAGDWLAPLPLQSVMDDIQAGTLAIINLDLNVPQRSIGIITHMSPAPSLDLSNFIDCIKDAVAEQESAM